ncbi:MAG: 4-hydroxy-3-methylbut-2-enyl diphosphate reductase [Chitinivibrionales bacterium]|nr:4-hydroxy-3-methylbut-2-enyl diphosphate reductase [Chitinivibrionales bacterium]
MKIMVAKTAGFCMGVKRAVDLALDQSNHKGGPLVTLGPLIHNRQTVDMLQQRGVTELDPSRAISAQATVLVRAHGVPPETEAFYRGRGHTIIDGTCPKVKTVHKVIERYKERGFAIVIAGDQGHAEVVGHLGYAGSSGHLIQSPAEVTRLPDLSKICLVAQTTFDTTTFEAIAGAIKQRYPACEVVIKKTICSATDQRQSETKLLASQVDAMIVVGGKNSANTRRLVDIAAEHGTPTFAVESESEIQWDKLCLFQTVGVTAGASTPNWMIQRVVDYLQFMTQTRKKDFPTRLRNFFDVLAHLNFFVACGAIAMLYCSGTIQELAFSVRGGLIAFFYFLSMYLWNSLSSIEMTQHLGISRYRFYRAHRTRLFMIAVACIALVMTLALGVNRSVFLLMLFATLGGTAYHLSIVPKGLRGLIRYRNLKDIPTSRDLFVALAWAVICTFLPVVMQAHRAVSASTIFVFFWLFFLAYLRSLIFDLRDIEGDRIMGRETLVTIVGERRAREAIKFIVIAVGCILLASPVILYGKDSALLPVKAIMFLMQALVLAYLGFFVKLSNKIRIKTTSVFNLGADGIFYLAGFLAYFASIVTR